MARNRQSSKVLRGQPHFLSRKRNGIQQGGQEKGSRKKGNSALRQKAKVKRKKLAILEKKEGNALSFSTHTRGL